MVKTKVLARAVILEKLFYSKHKISDFNVIVAVQNPGNFCCKAKVITGTVNNQRSPNFD